MFNLNESNPFVMLLNPTDTLFVVIHCEIYNRDLFCLLNNEPFRTDTMGVALF